MVRQVIGHHQRQEQVHPRQPGIAEGHALPGRPGRRGHLSGTEPRKPLLLRQRTDIGRQPCPQPELQPQPGGRPLRHPHREHPLHCQLYPCTEQTDSPDGRLRAEDGSHRQGNHRRERDQPVRRALVDAGAYQTHPGQNRQADVGRGLAQPGSVLPRRSGLHALPRTVQTTHPQSEDALRGDVQRLRRLLWHTKRPDRPVNAADD